MFFLWNLVKDTLIFIYLPIGLESKAGEILATFLGIGNYYQLTIFKFWRRWWESQSIIISCFNNTPNYALTYLTNSRNNLWLLKLNCNDAASRCSRSFYKFTNNITHSVIFYFKHITNIEKICLVFEIMLDNSMQKKLIVWESMYNVVIFNLYFIHSAAHFFLVINVIFLWFFCLPKTFLSKGSSTLLFLWNNRQSDRWRNRQWRDSLLVFSSCFWDKNQHCESTLACFFTLTYRLFYISSYPYFLRYRFNLKLILIFLKT